MVQKIQYCACRVNLSGQNCHTVRYDENSAVTWPEVQVLMMLHGEDNVTEIMPIGISETYPTTEKNRLASIYGHRIVEAAFPGRAFRMEYMMTADTDLPWYVDGKLSADPKPPAEEPKKPEPVSPPPDPPGTDHEPEEEDAPADIAAAPVFKPSRRRETQPSVA